MATINQDGHITSLVSANQKGGFSIVKYKGATNATSDGSNNGGTGWNIGHGLGVAPALVIVKKTSGVGSWYVGSDALGSSPWSTGNGQQIVLDSTASVASPGGSTKIWNSAPTTTTFNVGGWDVVNRNVDSYIAYCFANISGHQKIGSYVGNSSTTGPMVPVGFQPTLIIVKGITSGYASHWVMIDSVRDTDTVKDKRVLANLTNEQDDDANWAVEFNANGFQPKSSFSGFNHSSGTYLYMAFK